MITPSILSPKGTYDRHTCPTSTPWGQAQQQVVLMWGRNNDCIYVPLLWQVHTAGHGGTFVHPTLAARFFNKLPKECHAYGGSRLWFEEDCESNVPFFIFYNGLDPSCWLVAKGKQFPRERLLESIQRWMPNSIAAVRDLAARFDAALTDEGIPLRAPLLPQSS